MTPRLSTLRKIFLTTLVLGGFALVVFNIRPSLDTLTPIFTTPAPATIFHAIVKETTTQSTPSHKTVVQSEDRPWFMSNGKVWPKPGQSANLFPEDDPSSDRIVEQLMYVPPGYNPKTASVKLIFTESNWGSLNPNLFAKCPVSTCKLTSRQRFFKVADAVLYKDRISVLRQRPNSKQIWIMYLLECPLHTETMPSGINWTATYRHDSDIVTPYEKYVYYNSNIKYLSPSINNNNNKIINYARNKTKKVAWFVSNCFARNGRLQYGRELQKYIQVDIYGSCGEFVCTKGNQMECFKQLEKDYKFYLSFENSNCKDYITEKFYVNGLGYSTIPIVMGARPGDYERVAPYHSYIHVNEFKSPAELAQYLHRLDADDNLYNRYFAWKNTGEFINTYFWCRLCAMLHHNKENFEKSYTNLNKWWRGPGICDS